MKEAGRSANPLPAGAGYQRLTRFMPLIAATR
jgi:hypothetical protein